MRTTNALVRGGIDTMEKLCAMSDSDLKRVRNFGVKCRDFALLVRDRYKRERETGIYVGQGKYNYLRCHKRIESKSCDGCGTIKEAEMEQHVFDRMVMRLQEFQTITGGAMTKANPKLTALKVEMAKVEAEIEKLLDTLTGANPTLLSYANRKIETLDADRQSLAKQIADLSAEAVSPESIIRISGYLNDWGDVEFDDRRQVVDGMISLIRASGDYVDIEWKI